MNKDKLKTLLLTLLMSGLMSAGAAEKVIEDHFEARGSGRHAGSPLNGTSTEVGNVEWRTAPANEAGIVFTDRGSVTTGSNKSMGASVPIPDGAKEIRLEADVRVNETGWVGLAFGGEPLDAQFFSPKGAYVFAILRPGGIYSAFANASSQTLLCQSTLRGKMPTAFTHIEVIYKISEDRLTVRMDDKPVLEELSLGEKGYVPGPVLRAGFRFNGPPVVAGSPEVKNFKLTIVGEK
ncbi:MAG: hypothetical protein B9S32_05800 [Verrucomicrobia bacterium Tous-C9LFEB]|nr:MAG: hypothetical protein B9S32_05800 [Verrucomicrobia bacterium Tous-C9LFEB]